MMHYKTYLIICSVWIFIFSFLPKENLYAHASIFSDTCTVNDICVTASEILNVNSDAPFVCITGCITGAQPEVFNNACGVGEQPTVWYRVYADGNASLMNIFLYSDDFDAPSISLFQYGTNCNNLIPVLMTFSLLPCIVGSGGTAEAVGTEIDSNKEYYIAVSSLDGDEGDFELCVNLIGYISGCVTSRDIVVVERSGNGSLEGPFDPGETISICMNVNNYTAAGNGCQWFQGLVPVFGNGWDPSSFDANGQPVNTTINGEPIGLLGNGVYGVSTWDWFTDVDHHYDDVLLQVGDIDGNGWVDMCNIFYDPLCPNLGGLQGGCCGPCWGEPLGDILPGGWFAYGINGTCPTPGPPIRTDWGDGNSCGGGMGPWRFCFDLKIRDYPECLTDNTTNDLSLEFYTFADGQIGSWTGSASICAYDQPAILKLRLNCLEAVDLGTEFLPDFCAGDSLIYQITHPGVSHWTWQITPPNALLNPVYEGDNGDTIKSKLISPSSGPVNVSIMFTGYEQGTGNAFIKRLRFRIGTPITTDLPQLIRICEDSKDTVTINALNTTGGFPDYSYLWQPSGATTPSVSLLPPHQQSAHELIITDQAGCTARKVVQIALKPCLFVPIDPTDENNDEPTHEDPPIDDGNFTSPDIHTRSSIWKKSDELKVFPVPATNDMFVEWVTINSDAIEVIILDLNGHVIQKNALTNLEKQSRSKKINVRHYAPGIYFVMLQTKESTFVTRMMKMQ